MNSPIPLPVKAAQEPRFDALTEATLNLCPFVARQVFKELIPLMRRNSLPGFLPLEVREIAKELGCTEVMVYRSFHILKELRLLREGECGFYAPKIAAEIASAWGKYLGYKKTLSPLPSRSRRSNKK